MHLWSLRNYKLKMCRLGLNKKAKKEAAVSFVIADIQTIAPSPIHYGSQTLRAAWGKWGSFWGLLNNNSPARTQTHNYSLQNLLFKLSGPNRWRCGIIGSGHVFNWAALRGPYTVYFTLIPYNQNDILKSTALSLRSNWPALYCVVLNSHCDGVIYSQN